MSDVRPPDYIFSTKLAPQPPSLKYVSKSMAENVAFTFDIPFPVLKAWNEFLDKPENEKAEEEHVDDELTEGPIRWEVFQQRTSFIILSFALLQNNSDLMSTRGNHMIAIVKGSEKYETLKESFANVFSDINYLNSGNKIAINGKEITLEILFGGR